MQGDQEEASHETLSKERQAGAKTIFGRPPSDKLDKPPTCHASACRPALLAHDKST